MVYQSDLAAYDEATNDMMGCGCVIIAFLAIIFGCGGGWWWWIGPSSSDMCDPATVNCADAEGAIGALVSQGILSKAQAADDGSGDLHLDVWVTGAYWDLPLGQRLATLEDVRDELLCSHPESSWSGWALILFDQASGERVDRIECGEWGDWLPVDAIAPSRPSN